jgi:hypothetical protein
VGVPVKVQVEGQPVVLCWKGCVEKANNYPEQNLATVKELRTRHAATPPVDPLTRDRGAAQPAPCAERAFCRNTTFRRPVLAALPLTLRQRGNSWRHLSHARA